MYLLAGHLLKECSQIVNALAAAPNDDTRSGSVYVNLDLVGSTLNFDLRYSRCVELLLDFPANPAVLYKSGAEALIQVPFAVPASDYTYSETYRMNFLTQLLTLSP